MLPQEPTIGELVAFAAALAFVITVARILIQSSAPTARKTREARRQQQAIKRFDRNPDRPFFPE